MTSKGTTMLNLRIHNLGDVAVLRCAGRITADDRDRLRDAVLAQADIRIAVLDLAEVSAVDAAGLGMLLALRTWADATGKQLKLMSLTQRVEEVLELTNLRSQFEFCSVADMVDLLCRAIGQSQFSAAGMAWASSLSPRTCCA
jgi:anti-sigma B factor antagonist